MQFFFLNFEGDSAETCSWKISAHVDGGLSGGSRVRRPGSEDPIGVSGIFFIFIWGGVVS